MHYRHQSPQAEFEKKRKKGKKRKEKKSYAAAKAVKGTTSGLGKPKLTVIRSSHVFEFMG